MKCWNSLGSTTQWSMGLRGSWGAWWCVSGEGQEAEGLVCERSMSADIDGPRAFNSTGACGLGVCVVAATPFVARMIARKMRTRGRRRGATRAWRRRRRRGATRPGHGDDDDDARAGRPKTAPMTPARHARQPSRPVKSALATPSSAPPMPRSLLPSQHGLLQNELAKVMAAGTLGLRGVSCAGGAVAHVQ